MRAAIYARVGNPDQLAGQNQTEVLTGQNQTEVLTGQIRGMWRGSTEIDSYAVNGISGLQTDRPGLQKLLQNAGTYQEVVVCNLNRLSRSVPDVISLVRQLKDSGRQVYAPDRDMVEIMEAVSDISI